MDRTGCPEGQATDRVMLYGSDWIPGSCEVSFAFYVAFFTCLTVLRTFVVILQLAIWVAREYRVRNKTLGAPSAAKRRKLPMFPILSMCSCLALVLFTVLTSLNIANGGNGVPAFLLGLLYLPLAVQALILMTRVSRFGRRLIPRSAKEPSRGSSLNSTTRILRVIQVLHSSVSGMCVVSFFAGMFDPVYATFQVGVIGYAFQDVIIAFGLVYQYQRIIDAISSAQTSSSAADDPQQSIVPPPISSSAAAANAERNLKLKRVMTRLRLHQFVWFLMGPLVAAVWLVNVTRVTVPHYWMVMIFFSVELALTGALTFINLPKEWLQKVMCTKDKQTPSTLSAVAQTDALTPPVGTDNGAM